MKYLCDSGWFRIGKKLQKTNVSFEIWWICKKEWDLIYSLDRSYSDYFLMFDNVSKVDGLQLSYLLIVSSRTSFIIYLLSNEHYSWSISRTLLIESGIQTTRIDVYTVV